MCNCYEKHPGAGCGSRRCHCHDRPVRLYLAVTEDDVSKNLLRDEYADNQRNAERYLQRASELLERNADILTELKET